MPQTKPLTRPAGKVLDPFPADRVTFTPEEVGDRFGVTRQSVYNWIRKGDLPAIRMGGRTGRLFIRRSDLIALLERVGKA